MTGALPTGSVTFLLTDIEGSTRAWQSQRAGLAAAIQRHYELLDAWIRRHGGVRPEEQGEGDSVVAVFPDADAAVAAAVGAQRDLLAELPDLPVRMALHSGDATLRNERNYVGLTVIRCARIRSCGHGRQILASRATLDAVGERLPPEVTPRSLGHYGLKGLAGRTEIVQIDAAGLPDTFPPLRAGASAAGNLPQDVSTFIGRRTELAELTALVDAHRWVTVTGIAGVGKSRLCLAAAAAGAEAFTGGAWWVSLGGLDGGDVDDVAATIADACSIDRRARPLHDVGEFFGSVASALLVLDGADGVSSGVLATVRHLLATTNDLRIVVSCREPVSVAGETPYLVHPLDPPAATTVDELALTEAGALFLERLRGAGGSGSLTPAEVAAVTRICASWPTPADVEMIAIRAASAPVIQLADELAALGRSASTALASSAAWHVRDLDEVSRLVLQRSALFRRSMLPDAALAVVVGETVDLASAQAAIALLVERRVLRDEGERLHLDDRFRQVVAGWPADPDADAALRRYVHWCTGVAERFGAGGTMVPVTALADDLADMMAAIAAACAAELPDAYRLLAALGPRWHELDRWPELWAADAWLASRSPSDGELDWVAAVSRLSFAAAGRAEAAVHRLHDEAFAIAHLDGDVRSCDHLAFRAAAATLDDGRPGSAYELFDAARAHGSDVVATAIAARLVAAGVDERRSELDDHLLEHAVLVAEPDPIRALVRHLDRCDDVGVAG